MRDNKSFILLRKTLLIHSIHQFISIPIFVLAFSSQDGLEDGHERLLLAGLLPRCLERLDVLGLAVLLQGLLALPVLQERVLLAAVLPVHELGQLVAQAAGLLPGGLNQGLGLEME